MCKGRKVEVFNGSARSAPTTPSPSPATTGRRPRSPAPTCILAAGSVPRLIPGFERGGPIMTSDEVLDLDYVPARVAVIGGGAIGCEFASTFADLGAEVTILEGLPKILPGLDNDLANVVVRSFKKKKIDIRTGVMVTGHTPNDAGRHDRALRRGRGPRGRRRRRVGRPPPVRRPARPRRHRREGRRARASSSSTSSAAPARTACTPSATSSTRRSSPTSATPRRSSCVKQILGETAAAGACTTGCRGRSTATPRWRGPVPTRRPPRPPATTSSSPSTRSSSTAGPRSSARPTGW